MSAFTMQVACGCSPEGPIGMNPEEPWDGEALHGGFVKGRRYIWECPECKTFICVNMTLLEEE
jgi:hypothetical protein